MTLVDYRLVEDRFAHVDGRVARVDVQRSGTGLLSASVGIRLYAWWEHPLFLEARAKGASWGFDWSEDAERELGVVAVDPVRVEVTSLDSATDLVFRTRDPLLWQYEPAAEIFCNSDVDGASLRRSLATVPELVGCEAEVAACLGRISEFTAPFSLGYFPHSLFRHVRDALIQQGVRLFLRGEPEPPDPLVLFTADDTVSIVARDFQVDVPEFEHRPEWFKPA